jgi:PPP family 3-phenylpropionic acid transporter
VQPAAPTRSWALIGWYGAFTGGTALTPFLALLLMDRGVTASTATLLLGTLPAARLVVVPLCGRAADRLGASPVVRGGLALSALGALALAVTRDPEVAYAAVLAWAVTRAAVLPMVDATTVGLVGRGYGRIRAVGSVGYLLAAAGSGVVRGWWAPGPAILGTCLAATSAALAWFLPELAAMPPRRVVGLGAVVTQRVLGPLAGVSVAHGAALAVYEALFAVHVSELGFGPAVAGAGVALGVAVEVLVLSFGATLLGRLGPVALLALGVGAAVPRFALTAFARDPATIVAAQALHGLNFGCWWLASTVLFAEHGRPELRNATQALLSATAFGAGPLLGLVLAGGVLAYADSRALCAVAAGLSALGLALVGWVARQLWSTGP